MKFILSQRIGAATVQKSIINVDNIKSIIITGTDDGGWRMEADNMCVAFYRSRAIADMVYNCLAMWLGDWKGGSSGLAKHGRAFTAIQTLFTGKHGQDVFVLPSDDDANTFFDNNKNFFLTF